MAPGKIQDVFQEAFHTYECFEGELTELKEYCLPENYEEKLKDVVTHNIIKINIGGDYPFIFYILKFKKLSFEKTIRICGYLFPKKFREEAKGGITETRQEMLESGCSKLTVNLILLFKIVCFEFVADSLEWFCGF